MSQANPIPPPAPSTSIFKDNIFLGKVLFCTGGASGICRAMTEAVLRHGANGTIVGRNYQKTVQAAKELASATGRDVLGLSVDVREPAQLADAVAKTIEKFGKIDFVICGAAGNFLAPIGTLSENAFKTVISIDTLGTFNTVKATLRHVRESRGSYIHVSATLHYRGLPFQAHASAAKAGVDALSNVLAVEEGPRGVRSNVIAPGPIAATVGLEKLYNNPGRRPEAEIPAQRLGHVDDIANATVFLFSEAAHFISGQILVVDGGEIHTRSPYNAYPESVLGEKTKSSL